MSTELHEHGRQITRARVLMTLAHVGAFERLEVCRQLIALGAPPEAALAVLDQLRPDPYPEREAGMQAERERILAILDRPGAAADPAETLRLIEAG
jgi:hypothetical protein